MSKPNFSVVILAAGKGTRMNSALPKVLHPVAGTPMIRKVITAVSEAGASEVRVVVGYGEALVRQVAEPLNCVCFHQANQWGTADAVRSADPASLKGLVLILNGDHPLITVQDVNKLIEDFTRSRLSLAVVTSVVKKPESLGRIVREGGKLRAIVEAADASSDTLNIKEVNTGIYLAQAELLQKLLPLVQSHNTKNEFYLTDIIHLGLETQERVGALTASASVAFGVNTQAELATATRALFARKMKSLMAQGVVMVDPKRTYIEEDVQIGSATVIYPGAYLRGKTRVGSFCVLEPNCYIAHSEIADSVQIKAGSYLESSKVATKAQIGPYAHLRPGTEIGQEAHVGNFVEMKKTKFGARSKANHLTYLGDAEVGADTNIGCGTITCNYAVDRKKYRTKIGDNVFVGSDCQFVAPVTVGDHSVIASGSTITTDVPQKALAIARARQINKENYQIPSVASENPREK